MSIMHRLHVRDLALAVALLAVGCGDGIALNPMSTEPPIRTIDDDGGARGVDAPGTQGDDQADAGDADDVGADERSEGDVAADNVADVARDAAVEVRSDASDASDVSLDGSIDRGRDAPDAAKDGDLDASIDANREDSEDVRGDTVDDNTDTADAFVDVQDAAVDGTVDGPSYDAIDGCTVACWPAADYYVDASAPAGGNGSKLNPFKTITAAIDAYQASSGVAKKAYVAAGTYDEALGEHFPLVLRGLSLEGAGRDRTVIMGAGALDHSVEGGAFPGSYMTTMVVGDRALPTGLSGLSVRPPAPIPRTNFYGIFCDRGNATGEVASPGGQTHFDQIQAGPGYDTAVIATASLHPTITGCEMVMTGSVVTGGWYGLVARGCDASGVQAPVTLELGGEDPSSGNTFSWMQARDVNAKGVRVMDCVLRASIQNNAFVDSMSGVETYAEAIPPPYPYRQTHVIAKHNLFERLTSNGWMGIGRGPFLDEFSDNRVVNVTAGLSLPGAGTATGVTLYITNVGKFRRNQVIGNDFGLEANVDWPDVGPPGDFGTLDDPGENVFRCNSSSAWTAADFYLSGGDPTWTGTVSAVGNAWDHVPPTIQINDAATNGGDISIHDQDGITFDVRNSTLSTAVCPDGRVPGP